MQKLIACQTTRSPPPDGPYDVTISPSSPPAFIASGGSFNLSCGASSWPAASFSWYREKQLLEHFQEVLPQKVLEVYGLKKPAASYTCVATNSKTGRSVTSAAVKLGIVGESRRCLRSDVGVLLVCNWLWSMTSHRS